MPRRAQQSGLDLFGDDQPAFDMAAPSETVALPSIVPTNVDFSTARLKLNQARELVSAYEKTTQRGDLYEDCLKHFRGERDAWEAVVDRLGTVKR